jgi:hypothetical protein
MLWRDASEECQWPLDIIGFDCCESAERWLRTQASGTIVLFLRFNTVWFGVSKIRNRKPKNA